MIHPLLNKNSKHYDKSGNKPAIYYMEEEMSLIEMIGFCSGNIFKYEIRKKYKGCEEEDEKKIETYRNYRNLLMSFLSRETEKMSVRFVLDKNISIEYKI